MTRSPIQDTLTSPPWAGPTRADVARGYRGLVLERLGRHAEACAGWTTALAGFQAREPAEPAEYLRTLLAESDAHRDGRRLGR